MTIRRLVVLGIRTFTIAALLRTSWGSSWQITPHLGQPAHPGPGHVHLIWGDSLPSETTLT